MITKQCWDVKCRRAETQRDAVAALRSRAFVQRGVRDEATILDTHQDTVGEEVVERNARTYELVLEPEAVSSKL